MHTRSWTSDRPTASRCSAVGYVTPPHRCCCHERLPSRAPLVWPLALTTPSNHATPSHSSLHTWSLRRPKQGRSPLCVLVGVGVTCLNRGLLHEYMGQKRRKCPKKACHRGFCSSAACARYRDALLAGSVHSLGPRECTDPTGVSRLDAVHVLEMELQKVRRRACHERATEGVPRW